MLFSSLTSVVSVPETLHACSLIHCRWLWLWGSSDHRRIHYSSTLCCRSIQIDIAGLRLSCDKPSGPRLASRTHRGSEPALSHCGQHMTLQSNSPSVHMFDFLALTGASSLWLWQVTGFGGLAVSMFGVSSFGLLLLSIKLLKAPPAPPKP